MTVSEKGDENTQISTFYSNNVRQVRVRVRFRVTVRVRVRAKVRVGLVLY